MEKNKSLKRQQINSTDSDWKVTEKWTFGLISPLQPDQWQQNHISCKTGGKKYNSWQVESWKVVCWQKKIDLESHVQDEANKLGILLSSILGISRVFSRVFWASKGPLGRIQFFQSCYYKAFLTFESCKSYIGM